MHQSTKNTEVIPQPNQIEPATPASNSAVAAAATAFLTPSYPEAKAEVAAVPDPDRMVRTLSGNIAVWVHGTGPTVLLVHGWAGRHTDLAAFVQPLVASGLRVINFDLPAHGKSDGKTASIPDLAKGILGVADAFGPIAGIVAHSIGCAATGLALKQGLHTERTVLISPPSRYRDFAKAFARQVGVDPEDMLDALRKRHIDIDNIDFAAMAPWLKPRALVMHSKDDRVVPFENGAEIAAAWPDAQLIECNGLGHRKILADSQVIVAATQFLTV